MVRSQTLLAVLALTTAFGLGCAGNGSRSSAPASAAPSVESNTVEVPAHRVRYRVDAPWQARQMSLADDPGVFNYEVTDPTAHVPSAAESFVLSVLPPGHDFLYDLNNDAISATAARVEEELRRRPDFSEGEAVARVRPIGGAAGVEARATNRVSMWQTAMVKFDDGVIVYINGEALLQVLSAEEQERVFEAMIDSIERY